MDKVIKRWGRGLGIYLDKEDVRINKLKEGDVIDIELVKKKVINGYNKRRV